MDKNRLIFIAISVIVIYMFWPLVKGLVLFGLLAVAAYYVLSGKHQGQGFYRQGQNKKSSSNVIDAEFKKKESKDA